jgi:Ca-activated chloride channel family protein
MIEFARPLWLWGLLGVPLVAALMAFGVRRRRAETAAFVGRDLEPALAPGFSWRRHLARGVLRALALAMLLVALAGPRFGSQLVKVEREGIDVVIALDTSLSMLAEDVPPNRLERAKREIADLISGLQGDRVGLVVFSGDAVTLCPLTVDYGAAMMLAQSVDVYTVSEPGTAIADAIETAVALFEGSEKGDRAVILVTDGENTQGDPDQAMKLAVEREVRVYPIGIGSPKGELIPERGTDGSVTGYKKDARGETVLSRLDEATLQRIAAGTGGKYLPATAEGLELKVLYDEISGMQRRLIKGEFVERKKERFWLPLSLALGALLCDLSMGTRAARRRGARSHLLHTGAAVLAVVAALALSAAPAAAGKSVDRGKVRAGNKVYRDGDFPKAFSLYREALGDTARPPRNAYGAYYNGANALYQQKQFGRAIDYYQRSFSPDSVLNGRMLYNRGNALLKSGRAAEAVESYVQALHYLPDDEDIRHNLEMAVLQKQQQQQQQQQNQDGNEKQDRKQNQQGSQPDSSRADQDRDSQQQEQQQQQQEQQQNESQQQPQQEQPPRDAPPDSSAAPPSEEQMQQLSKEDAMRILQALEDREKQLQKERRKAAFRKLKRSGKDW